MMNPQTGVPAGSGGVSPKVFPRETSSPPRASGLFGNAISTSESPGPIDLALSSIVPYEQLSFLAGVQSPGVKVTDQ